MPTGKILALSFAILLLSIQVKEKPRAKLQGYDGITLPGEEVILKAKLEKDDFFHRDLEDQKILFRRGQEVLGTAITGEQGIGRIAYRPEKEGTYRITVALDPRSPYQGDEAEIFLQVIPKDRKILICDVDHTVADISSLKFLITPNEEVEPLTGAPEALDRLSQTYQILYLTARDDAFMRKTKAWMEEKDLPRAPIFFWDYLGSVSQSHTRFKKEQIASFKEKWPNVAVGVGDREGDAKAYLENGLAAYILGDEDDLPEGAIRSASWQEILSDLIRDQEE